jgi:hypothetical protein
MANAFESGSSARFEYNPSGWGATTLVLAGQDDVAETNPRLSHIVEQPFVRSVVVASLVELDLAFTDTVHEAMLLGNAPGPEVRTEVPQRLRLARAGKGVSEGRLHEGQHTPCVARIGGDPPLQVLQAVRGQDSDTTTGAGTRIT